MVSGLAMQNIRIQRKNIMKWNKKEPR